jgi:hypothetical protein
LDGLIFNMPHAEDLHAIELAGATFSKFLAVTAPR